MNRRGALLAVVLAGASACAAKDIVVADVPLDGGEDSSLRAPDAGADAPHEASDTGDASPPPGPPCHTINDCAANEYCVKNTCADAVGGCEQRPDVCPVADTDFHCGCDGVTYWNDCLRQRDGVAASTEGQCAVGQPCTDTTGASCPVSDGSCAHLVYGQNCPQSFPGVCWVLPDQCPEPGPTGPMWLECGGPGGDCLDFCNAIREGTPHQSAPPPGDCPSGSSGGAGMTTSRFVR